MSTTFGVRYTKKYTENWVSDSEPVITVAFRRNNGTMYFKNPLAPLLPNKTKVIAMDNEPQGIHTIGDIKKAMYEQKEKLNTP